MSIHVSLLGCLDVAVAISWALDGRLMRFFMLPVNTALVLGVQIIHGSGGWVGHSRQFVLFGERPVTG